MRYLRALILSAVLCVVLGPAILGRHDASPAASAKAVAAQQVRAAEPVQAAEAFAPALAGQGCGWFSNGGQTQVENSGAQIAMCVFEQILQNVTQPTAIGVACGNITLSQVLAALDSILNYYNQPQASDASPAMLCGTGTPPVQGAQPCLDTNVITRAKTVRAATADKLAGKN